MLQLDFFWWTMTQIFIRFTYKYTQLCKSLGFIRFLMFLKEVSSAHQGRIYWIKNAVNCEILLQFKIKVFYCNIFLNTIYSCDAQLNFQHHYSSVTWSFRNHSNMLIWCSWNMYYYQCWKKLCQFSFLFFSGFSD